jgi:hypothetical protein
MNFFHTQSTHIIFCGEVKKKQDDKLLLDAGVNGDVRFFAEVTILFLHVQFIVASFLIVSHFLIPSRFRT